MKCPDCGKEISSRTMQCPFCGCPAEYYEQIENHETTSRDDTILQNKDVPEEKNKTTGLSEPVHSGSIVAADTKPIVTKIVETYSFVGRKVQFTQEQVDYIDLRYEFEKVAGICHAKIDSVYDNKSLGDLIVFASEQVDNAMGSLINRAVELLYKNDIIISNEEFIRKNYEISFSYNNMISEVIERYAEITNERSQLEQYRSLQEASRSRFVGGGFGVKGAIKGAVTAGVMNAGLDFARSFGNSRRRKEDQDYINQKLLSLKNSDYCRNRIVNGAYTCIVNIFKGMLEEIKVNAFLFVDTFDEYSYKSAQSLAKATKEHENDDEKIIDNYVKAINMNPYITNHYSELITLCRTHNDEDGYDNVYALAHRLGLGRIHYGVDTVDDVELNFFINQFFKESDVFKRVSFNSKDLSDFEAISSENERLNEELKKAGYQRCFTNDHMGHLDHYLREYIKTLDGDEYIAIQEKKDDVKSLSMSEYVKFIINEQVKTRMLTLPYFSLYIPGTKYTSSQYDFQEKDVEMFTNHLQKGEAFLILYDSGIMHMGNTGFGVSQNYFYDFKGKKSLHFNDILQFDADTSDFLLVVTTKNKETINIPFRFKKLSLEKENWVEASEDTAKLLNMLLNHYRVIYSSVDDENNDDADIIAKISFALNEIEKKGGWGIDKLDELNDKLDSLGVLKDGKLILDADKNEKCKEIIDRYHNMVKELSKNALHDGGYSYDSIEDARLFRDELKEIGFSIYDVSYDPDELYKEICLLQKAKSQRAKAELQNYEEQYERIKEYSNTKYGRFELTLIREIKREFEIIRKEGGFCKYNWIVGLYNWIVGLQNDDIPEEMSTGDEHEIFSCIYELTEKLIISNHQIFAPKKASFKDMMEEDYNSDELVALKLEEIVSVEGKNNLVGAHWVIFNTNKGKYSAYIGLDGVKLANCITIALKAFRDENYSYEFPDDAVNREKAEHELVMALQEVSKSLKNEKANKITCINCGNSIDAEVKFCNFCGKDPHRKMVFCTHCGKPIEDKAKFCNYCGKVNILVRRSRLSGVARATCPD